MLGRPAEGGNVLRPRTRIVEPGINSTRCPVSPVCTTGPGVIRQSSALSMFSLFFSLCVDKLSLPTSFSIFSPLSRNPPSFLSVSFVYSIKARAYRARLLRSDPGAGCSTLSHLFLLGCVIDDTLTRKTTIPNLPVKP